MSQRNLLSEWSWLVVDSFAAAGVRTVVVSPGSRSTPLVLAALRHPQLECESVIDERAAAFYALGLARVTGEPALLICTSGSAGAHYYPAILEAQMSRTPLLAMTADRPAELMDCTAPQTVDQNRMFGEHVRMFIDLGAAQGEVATLRAVRRRVVQGVVCSRWPAPGPVHFNFPARKPLEPLADEVQLTSSEVTLARTVRTLVSQTVPHVRPPKQTPDPQAILGLARKLVAAKSGLIVAGPLPLFKQDGLCALASQLAETLGFVLAPEATSGMRYQSSALPNLSMRLRSANGEPTEHVASPEVVLQIGRPPVSSAWPPFLEAEGKGPRLFVLSDGEWSDPTQRAEEILIGDFSLCLSTLTETVAELANEDAAGLARRNFCQTARRVDQKITAVVQDLLGPRTTNSEPSEPAVARALVEFLPSGSLLAVGNSLPIRLVEDWGGQRQNSLQLVCQRGVNGIDGLVAGFAGSVRAFEQMDHELPMAVLLLGDVSALHDLGGFAALTKLKSTKTSVVILNNRGGRIFEQLPISSRLEQDQAARGVPAMNFWTTPHDHDFEHVARQFSLSYTKVFNDHELIQTLTTCQGVSILELAVPENGVDALQRKLDQALGELFRAEDLLR